MISEPESRNAPIEVYIVDDDDSVLRSTSLLLRTLGILTRTYSNPVEFLLVAEHLRFGVVVSDFNLPEFNGLELMCRLREVQPSFPVIVITGYGQIDIAVEAMKRGAHDFIEKPFDADVLLAAIRSAWDSGERKSLPRELDIRKVAKFQDLTPQEHVVLEHLIAGNTNKGIARIMNISPRTVEAHRAKVMSKTGASSLSDLVRMSIDASR